MGPKSKVIQWNFSPVEAQSRGSVDQHAQHGDLKERKNVWKQLYNNLGGSSVVIHKFV
jgi:hypothetical protein